MEMQVPNIPDDSYFKRLSRSPELKDAEAFQYEFRRLASFVNIQDCYEIDLFNAAKNGLYFISSINKICCFSCGLSIQPRPRQDPVIIHNEQRPSCPFVANNETNNKPLWISDDEGSDVDDCLEEDRPPSVENDLIAQRVTQTPHREVEDILVEESHIQQPQSVGSLPELPQASPVGSPAFGSLQVAPSTHNEIPDSLSPQLSTSLPDNRGIAQSSTGKSVHASSGSPRLVREQRSVTSQSERTPANNHSLSDRLLQPAISNHQKPECNRQPPSNNQQLSDSSRQAQDRTDLRAAMEELNRNRARNNAPVPNTNMFIEEVRLQTYDRWPSDAKVSASDLARLGFFYRGEEDKAQCAFCNRVLMKWEEGDDIEAEHRKYSPECPFVLGTETRNIPIRQHDSGTLFEQRPRDNPAGGEPPELQRSEGGATSATMLTRRPLTSEQPSRAMHPAYGDYQIRLDSFVKNAEWTSENVAAESLAQAGFFFAGYQDNVRCHFCDGGLRNWERGDNPWVEHARWFPRCCYLIAQKGNGFIKEVQSRFPVRREPREEPVTVRDPLLKLPLKANFINEAREMGFTDSQIRTAVEKQQTDKGRSFLDMQSLVDALISLVPESTPAAPAPTATTSSATADSIASNNIADNAASNNVVNKKPNSGRRNSPTNTRETEEEEKPASQSKSKKKKNKKKKAEQKGSNTPPPAPTTLNVPEDDEESRSLQEENRQLKEQRMCKVCMDEEVNIVFLPCGHLVVCSNCAPALRSCPICRALIRGSLRTYLS